jgi:hypothetical protein
VIGERLRVVDAGVLTASVAVVDQLDVCARTAAMKGHSQGVEDEVGAHVRGELPADDRSAVGVEHEGEEDESVPAAQVGDVRDPSRFGLVALKSRWTRSGRLPACGSGRVVRHGLPRRFAPTIPLLRISRCTRQRGTRSPARRSAFHIRR